MNEYEFYDLKTDNYPSWAEEAFYKGLKEISQSDYQLKYNYTVKELNLNKMASFTVIVDPVKKELICFSGLQINTWPHKIARVSSRHYMSKKYARHYLRKRLNWKICVIEQIKVAYGIGIDQLFFSTELMNEEIFKLQCKNSTLALNTVFPELRIIPLDGLYDTTNKGIHWQKIGQLIINDNIWDFPLERKKFKDAKKKI